MKIFKDLFTGKEVLTDAYKMEEVNDVMYKVIGTFKTEVVSGGGYNIGGNPGEEEPDEVLEDKAVSGCNVVLANKLKETGFSDKKQLSVLVKAYMKKLMDRVKKDNPAREASLKANAPKLMKDLILKNFDDWQFFFDEDLNEDGMIILMHADPADSSGMTQHLYYWKDGLIEEKV